MVLSFIIFVLIRKYNKNHNPGLAILLFILFYPFKISIFIFLDNTLMVRISKDNKNYTEEMFFYSCAVGAIYLILIIYSLIKKQISLLISFGFGILITLIFFVSLFFSINLEFATFNVILISFEIILLFISILITQKTDILEEDNPIHNILMIDYYKYFIVMLIAFLAVSLCLLIIYFCDNLARSGGSSNSLYTDNKGNIYDKFGQSMGITLSRKPAYVDENGKFYDEFQNGIL